MLNHEHLMEVVKPAMSDVTANLWASREFEDQDFEDPRIIATRAAIRDARLPDRLFQPGGYLSLTQMHPGVEYSVK